MEEGDGRGVARGKGRESQEVSGKKEGVKTGKKKKKAEEGWKKEGVKTEKKKKEEKGVGGGGGGGGGGERKTTCMYYLCVFLGGVCSYLKVIQLLIVQNTIIVHVTDLWYVIP